MTELAERDHFIQKYSSPEAKRERDDAEQFERIRDDLMVMDYHEDSSAVLDNFTDNAPAILATICANWFDECECGRLMKQFVNDAYEDER